MTHRSKNLQPSLFEPGPPRVGYGRAPRRRESSVEEVPPRELSIDLEADERLGRVTGRAGAS